MNVPRIQEATHRLGDEARAVVRLQDQWAPCSSERSRSVARSVGPPQSPPQSPRSTSWLDLGCGRWGGGWTVVAGRQVASGVSTLDYKNWAVADRQAGRGSDGRRRPGQVELGQQVRQRHFPLPVWPTRATVWPGLTEKLISSSTGVLLRRQTRRDRNAHSRRAIRVQRPVGCRALGRRAEQSSQPLSAGHGRECLVVLVADRLDGLEKHVGQEKELDEIAQRQRAAPLPSPDCRSRARGSSRPRRRTKPGSIVCSGPGSARKRPRAGRLARCTTNGPRPGSGTPGR